MEERFYNDMLAMSAPTGSETYAKYWDCHYVQVVVRIRLLAVQGKTWVEAGEDQLSG